MYSNTRDTIIRKTRQDVCQVLLSDSYLEEKLAYEKIYLLISG
jgi:hypothetical protein